MLRSVQLRIFSLFLFFSSIIIGNCVITPDEMIMGSLTKYGTTITSKRIYQIRQFSDRNYFKVYSYYGKVEILDSKEVVLSTLKDGEKDFIFNYQDSIYYLIFTPPNPLVPCGFQVLSSNIEYTNILTSSLTLYLVKEREFEKDLPRAS